MFAFCTNANEFCADPAGVVPTLFADEPIGPLAVGQVLVTGFRVVESLVKFNFGFGKAFTDLKICHGGLLLEF